MIAGCIGEKLGHSLSPQIHRQLGDYAYHLWELTPAQLPAFFKDRAFDAVNVTIPYKQAVLPLLDELSPRAAAVGAVNTVLNRHGRLIGYNTDCGGMTALLRLSGLSLTGQRVLILGTGGTSRTALAVAREQGAAAVLRVSRTGREGALTYEQALTRTDTTFLINTTPMGMHPDTETLPLDPAAFPALTGVADAVYHPLRTRLVLAARQQGIPAAGGLRMLVEQAALGCALFTGRPVSPETAEQVYTTVRQQQENPVLIGMPGCGKSTVGEALAQKLRRPFYDTDTLVTQETGLSPAALVQQRGEAALREAEAAVIRRLAPLTGVVIATGGGSILAPDNVRRLRQNGRLFWLNRPLEALPTTPDRPLSATKEALFALWTQRRPLYRAAADVTVPVTDVAKTVAAVLAAR